MARGWARLRAGRTRSAFLAVTFTALSWLLLSPVCNAVAAQAALPAHSSAQGVHDHAPHAAGGGPGNDELQCCTALDSAIPSYASDTATSFAKDGAALAPAGATPLLALGAHGSVAPRSRSAPGALERIKSYHARSARMLR